MKVLKIMRSYTKKIAKYLNIILLICCIHSLPKFSPKNGLLIFLYGMSEITSLYFQTLLGEKRANVMIYHFDIMKYMDTQHILLSTNEINTLQQNKLGRTIGMKCVCYSNISNRRITRIKA